MEIVLYQRLIIIVGAVAILAFIGKRKWITPVETAWIGSSMIFAATGWVLQAVLAVTMSYYSSRTEAILIAFGLTTPLLAALIVGLVILVRRLIWESVQEAGKPPIKN